MQAKAEKQQTGKQCSAFQSHSAIRFAVEITGPLASRATLTIHTAIKGDPNSGAIQPIISVLRMNTPEFDAYEGHLCPISDFPICASDFTGRKRPVVLDRFCPSADLAGSSCCASRNQHRRLISLSTRSRCRMCIARNPGRAQTVRAEYRRRET